MLEAAGLAVLKHKVPYRKMQVLPMDLERLLDGAGRCSVCRGPYLVPHCEPVRAITLGGLTDTLINMPGDMQVPATYQLCSLKCEKRLYRK